MDKTSQQLSASGSLHVIEAHSTSMTTRDAVVVLAGPPLDTVEIPAAVRLIAGKRRIRPVWLSQTGGLTFEIGSGSSRCFLKWVPLSERQRLEDEALRLRWASAYAPVPKLLESGEDEEGTWLVTAPLPGSNAVTPAWKARPFDAASAIGEGLRQLHDALPVERCAFSWSVEERVAEIHRRASRGALQPEQWHEEHRSFSVDEALRILDEAPGIDRIVVCHGDACAPNTLIDSRARCSGHVDFGVLGTADRWADLAVATWSMRWSYGPGFEDALLSSYGIEPEPERTRYYRLLYDLGP
jgi:kanamycin kinase